MAKRSEKRDQAKARYIELRSQGVEVNLRELAEELGVSYSLLRKWKKLDDWEGAIKRKRGGQPGNRNSAGKKNAKGNHGGAPVGNKNAETHGAYSQIVIYEQPPEYQEFYNAAPTDALEVMRAELKLLQLREKMLLDKITEYSRYPDGTLFPDGLLDMRVPGGRGKQRVDSAIQQMGMHSMTSAFARGMKLQETLNKIQGRIATVTANINRAEENKQRIELDRQRLDILRMRATGAVDIPDEETGADEASTDGASALEAVE